MLIICLKRGGNHIKNLLTISQFQKLVNTTRDTLLHYDEINLFIPELRTENGYRYYSINQVQDFIYIKTLKEMQLPLQSIAKIRDGDTTSFTDLKKTIDDTVYRLQSAKAMIEAREYFIQLQSVVPKLTFITNYNLPQLSIIYYPFSDNVEIYDLLKNIDNEAKREQKILTWIVGFEFNLTNNKNNLMIVEKVNTSPQICHHSIYLIDGSYDLLDDLVDKYLASFKNEYGFHPHSFQIIDIHDNFQFGDTYQTTFMFVVKHT